MPITKFTYI